MNGLVFLLASCAVAVAPVSRHLEFGAPPKRWAVLQPSVPPPSAPPLAPRLLGLPPSQPRAPRLQDALLESRIARQLHGMALTLPVIPLAV